MPLSGVAPPLAVPSTVLTLSVNGVRAVAFTSVNVKLNVGSNLAAVPVFGSPSS